MAELSTPHVTKGMDHVVQGVATAVPLRDAIIRFGMVHSHSWEKQGARRERFKERMTNLVANPPTDNEEGEDWRGFYDFLFILGTVY